MEPVLTEDSYETSPGHQNQCCGNKSRGFVTAVKPESQILFSGCEITAQQTESGAPVGQIADRVCLYNSVCKVLMFPQVHVVLIYGTVLKRLAEQNCAESMVLTADVISHC